MGSIPKIFTWKVGNILLVKKEKHAASVKCWSRRLFVAFSFFLGDIFNLSEKMTDNFCGFPSKLVKFADSACRLSDGKRSFAPWRTKPTLSISDHLHTIHSEWFIFLKKHFSPSWFFFKQAYFSNAHWFGLAARFDLWHGHFWAVHHPARIQIPSDPLQSCRPVIRQVSERDPPNQRSISASVAARWGWRSLGRALLQLCFLLSETQTRFYHWTN